MLFLLYSIFFPKKQDGKELLLIFLFPSRHNGLLILGGGHIGQTLEALGKILGRIEAQHIGNLRHIVAALSH